MRRRGWVLPRGSGGPSTLAWRRSPPAGGVEVDRIAAAVWREDQRGEVGNGAGPAEKVGEEFCLTAIHPWSMAQRPLDVGLGQW